MIADTTFLIDFLAGDPSVQGGAARHFQARHRSKSIRTTIICLAEVAVAFPKTEDAWEYFKWWRVYPLHRGVADAAADVDRELIKTGRRLGENDNWIAGICRYYREPVLSRDVAFDRVPGLRRIIY